MAKYKERRVELQRAGRGASAAAEVHHRKESQLQLTGWNTPLWCHCMSLMRRTDWICGIWAPNSLLSLNSPFSNRYW